MQWSAAVTSSCQADLRTTSSASARWSSRRSWPPTSSPMAEAGEATSPGTCCTGSSPSRPSSARGCSGATSCSTASSCATAAASWPSTTPRPPGAPRRSTPQPARRSGRGPTSGAATGPTDCPACAFQSARMADGTPSSGAPTWSLTAAPTAPPPCTRATSRSSRSTSLSGSQCPRVGTASPLRSSSATSYESLPAWGTAPTRSLPSSSCSGPRGTRLSG
mmetsp:Transcript_63951/g.206027  ORF Transcript_63951/g.206027 Transcript_63951/m.206027 type:complete len:220 (+) Transcript_63951:656-1315(+)